MNNKGQFGIIFGTIISSLFIIIVLFFIMFPLISYDNYGIEKEFGKLKPNVLETGFNYVGIGTVINVNNQIRNYEIIIESTSIDLQDVTITLNVNMRIKKDKVYYYISNYRNEETYNQYLNNKLQERIKVIVLKYKAEQFIYNRLNISNEIISEVKSIDEIDYFDILDISIKNIEYSDEFTLMLERKAQVDIERDIIIKQKENVILTNNNIALISDVDGYFKYMISQKWNGESSLTIIQ